MRILLWIFLAIGAEALLQVAFWSDPDNYDCGNDCGGAQRDIVGYAAFVIVPALIVMLMVVGAVRLYRRRR